MIQADALGGGTSEGPELDLEKELEKEMSQACSILVFAVEVLLVICVVCLLLQMFKNDDDNDDDSYAREVLTHSLGKNKDSYHNPL